MLAKVEFILNKICNLLTKHILALIFACLTVLGIWLGIDYYDVFTYLFGEVYKYNIFRILHNYNFISLLPMLIALFYFFYKNQQTLSDSYVLKLPIGISEIFWGYVYIISNIFWLLSGIEKHCNFGAINFVLSICCCLWFTKYVFQNMHVNRLNERFYKKFLFNSELILNTSNNFITRKLLNDKDVLNEIAWNIDVLYQLSFFSVKHNMNTMSKESQEYMQKMLHIFAIKLLPYGIKNGDFATHYIKVYRDLLKNQKKYIIELYEVYENRSCEMAIKNLLDTYPKKFGEEVSISAREALDEYFKALWSLAMFFSERDRNRFQSLLKELSQKSDNTESRDDLIVVYRALVVNAIYKADLNWLTEVCYIQKRSIKNWHQCDKNNTEFSKAIELLQDSGNGYRYDGMMLFILLLAIIKAVELAEYRQVGFLVKYVVSNYDSKQIQKVYQILKSNKCKDEEIYRISFYSRLSVDFNLNEDICNYCLKKATLLIYMQQYYRKVDSLLSLDIFQVDDDGFSLDYCKKKIYSAEKEYGMIAIGDYRTKKEYSYEVK